MGMRDVREMCEDRVRRCEQWWKWHEGDIRVRLRRVKEGSVVRRFFRVLC